MLCLSIVFVTLFLLSFSLGQEKTFVFDEQDGQPTATRGQRSYYWDAHNTAAAPWDTHPPYDPYYQCYRKRGAEYQYYDCDDDDYYVGDEVYAVCAAVFFPMFCFCLLLAGYFIYQNGNKLTQPQGVPQAVVGTQTTPDTVTIV
eukprot:CAMPEP_0168587420 /NCGR_PEP_ID=MMETSP0420-20121227/4866_1 /TAXON_ID=498008 /ORGANISM="Pessonella sp." /LENGTH=143 /DNA_ID=CAMNT_0008622693 /DNA_START=57 /DNA_END=488 /DNA_ORIENTATION=+